MSENDALCAALNGLAAEMRAERAERLQLAKTVDSLQKTVGRFVVAMERQLASGQAAQRRAERALTMMDPERVAAIDRQLDRKLGKG